MEYVIVGFLAVNSLLLIGVAGSLAKLIRYVRSSDSQKDQWMRIINMKKTNPDNRSGSSDRSNWDGIPMGKNWDGIPS